ncbi:MAG: mandelate racemase [Chloroflexales bacterium]|nr:mandelate racemase [Chloroflexales bacterium]
MIRTTTWSVPIERVAVSAYTIPTDAPESDGTFTWDETTIVVIEVHAADLAGLGYSYTTPAAARLIADSLAGVVRGHDAMAVPEAWAAMVHAVRNVGRPGIASSAIAAVDTALWDLKARLLSMPLVDLLGVAQTAMPIYGSGGFTSYTEGELRAQLGGWAEQGLAMVKMKVGREPGQDPARVRAARDVIGPAVALFVDANGAYTRKQALALAGRFAEADVTWFEEPVSSDDLAGLRLLRDQGPPGMAIAAGEYGYDLPAFRRLLEAGAVDVLQADATRCAGISEFLRVGALCAAHIVPLSAHTAPALHLHPCCALAIACHIEYFHDHARIERMLFDGTVEPADGMLRPDRSRPGMGLELKRADVAQYAVDF